jgi:hypothetical protein
MEWTNTKPTGPGWYWHRAFTAINGVKSVQMCEIYEQGGVLLVAGLQPHSFILSNASGEWAGPLEPPRDGAAR